MEVRDPVHGTVVLSDDEVSIIETQEYQRLRAIKQLGFSEFSFPGATHNRFLHSIGVCHLAGLAFDAAFGQYKFSSSQIKKRLRQTFRLAALLHDIGHGPLSHTTEEVMPQLSDLKLGIYKKSKRPKSHFQRRANHEDYTLKYINDSFLTEKLKKTFSDIDPFYISALIDKTLIVEDDFFVDQGLDFRPILAQLVSSELDVDRMDYLERDSYFCGTNYGKIDLFWIFNNLQYHNVEDKLYLALNRRALYTFDDFLISRHHMHLMVYFHHKSIIYEEMLTRYLTSKECDFFLPPSIEDYTRCDDYALYENMNKNKNIWAQRIAKGQPFRVLIELHATDDNPRPQKMLKALEKEGVEAIHSSSHTRLSKYHTSSAEDRALPIYVVDQYDKKDIPQPIEQCTAIFHKYEEARIIDRIYVASENFSKADKILKAY